MSKNKHANINYGPDVLENEKRKEFFKRKGFSAKQIAQMHNGTKTRREMINDSVKMYVLFKKPLMRRITDVLKKPFRK